MGRASSSRVVEWWVGLKIARTPTLKTLPLEDVAGRPFVFSMADPVVEMLHRIDQNASGQIAISEEVTNPATRNRYIWSFAVHWPAAAQAACTWRISALVGAEG